MGKDKGFWSLENSKVGGKIFRIIGMLADIFVFVVVVIVVSLGGWGCMLSGGSQAIPDRS